MGLLHKKLWRKVHVVQDRVNISGFANGGVPGIESCVTGFPQSGEIQRSEPLNSVNYFTAACIAKFHNFHYQVRL